MLVKIVAQDGTITLGTYGCVNIAGLNLCQAKAVIENHLSKHLLNPEISISVAAYNSKVYYVVVDGGGFINTSRATLATGQPYYGADGALAGFRPSSEVEA